MVKKIRIIVSHLFNQQRRLLVFLRSLSSDGQQDQKKVKKIALEDWLKGRELVENEIPGIYRRELQEQMRSGKVQSRPGIILEETGARCKRCNAGHPDQFHLDSCSCGKKCTYCLECLQMGKVTQCTPLYWMPDEGGRGVPSEERLLAWEGELSAQQKEASSEVVAAMSEGRTHLVWAVAGAGKTEMLFEGIEKSLQEGKRVCLASPRVDVCLELAPRLQSAFPTVSLAVLHGAMETPYQYTPLAISTTHQLLRFREAFDVLIIDEVDAFPFHLDESLQYAAKKALKQEASLIYLSATPDEKLRKRVKQKELTASVLPARYHRHMLPVPVCKWAGNWRRDALKYPFLSAPVRMMRKWIREEKRFLVFVPNIDWMEQFEKKCRKWFPTIPFAAVSSIDPKRKEKVLAMRKEEIRFLLTTTILERGVTFPDVHVLVLGAEDRTFTEAALVQISGRVGRSPSYPKGEVVFMHNGQTRGMKKAIRQIKEMNRLALSKGYVDL